MPSYPDINGLRYDYSSVEINVTGRVVTGVKEDRYSHKLEPGKVRGTPAQINGRTRGQYEAEASVTLHKQQAQELIAALGPGYMEVAFEVVVHYADARQPVTTDRIVGCRIKSQENAHQEGADALSVKFDLDVNAVIENGVEAIRNLSV